MNNYTGREIAIFSDVHALYEPLLSVINDIKERNISEVYSLGDNIGFGINPEEVLDLIIDNNIVMINGNAEEYAIIGTDPYKDYLWWTMGCCHSRIQNSCTVSPSSDDPVYVWSNISGCK